jgi:DNA-binding helix-hairpin-helix protein with protein kinase domain
VVVNGIRLSTGRALTLGAKLAEGGQGTVYELRESEGLLAKVFRQTADRKQHRKLQAMIRLRTPDLERAAAWPSDIIIDAGGACVGFVMPRIAQGREIDRLAHPAEQRLAFPTIEYGFLLHVAMNVARAAASIHATGCVIGDLNERNVLVLTDGTVRFIDVDSFQIVSDGEVFPCPVGSELFTAPELRGRTLANEKRTANHDAFGLAVLIFQLIVLGRHPFAGVPRDGHARNIEDAIREGLYAYAEGTATRVSPPPDTISIAALGSLCDLFRRAFTTQSRPSAEEWMHAINHEKSRLRRCDRNPRHAILAGVSRCPLCALRRDPMPAGISTTPVPDLGGLSIGELITQAARLEPIRPLKQRFSQSELSSGDRYVPLSPRQSHAKANGIGVGLAGALTAAVCPLSGEARLLALGLGVVVGLIMFGAGKIAESDAASEFPALKRAAEEALEALGSIESQAANEETTIREQADPLWKAIGEAREVLATAESRMLAALAGADRSWSTHRLEEFLRRSVIRHASISGIGPSRSATLASFGIETAADVGYTTVSRVPGFGPELTRRVVNWRRTQEREFSVRGPGPTPPEWINQIKMTHQQELASTARRLRRDAQDYAQRWHHYDRRLSDLALSVDAARVKARTALLAIRE